jgi:hypothetical protein
VVKKKKSGKDDDDLREDIADALEEELGKPSLTLEEIEVIEKVVPDVEWSFGVFIDTDPQPGEGPKVALVKDKSRKVHRVPLKPN